MLSYAKQIGMYACVLHFFGAAHALHINLKSEAVESETQEPARPPDSKAQCIFTYINNHDLCEARAKALVNDYVQKEGIKTLNSVRNFRGGAHGAVAYAVYVNNIPMLKALIAVHDVDLSVASLLDGHTPAQIAARHGNRIAELLLLKAEAVKETRARLAAPGANLLDIATGLLLDEVNLPYNVDAFKLVINHGLDANTQWTLLELIENWSTERNEHSFIARELQELQSSHAALPFDHRDQAFTAMRDFFYQSCQRNALVHRLVPKVLEVS